MSCEVQKAMEFETKTEESRKRESICRVMRSIDGDGRGGMGVMEGWRGGGGRRRRRGGMFPQETSSGDQPTDVCDQAPPPSHNHLA